MINLHRCIILQYTRGGLWTYFFSPCVCINLKDVNEPEACILYYIHSRRMLIIIVAAVQYREPEGLSWTAAAAVAVAAAVRVLWPSAGWRCAVYTARAVSFPFYEWLALALPSATPTTRNFSLAGRPPVPPPTPNWRLRLIFVFGKNWRFNIMTFHVHYNIILMHCITAHYTILCCVRVKRVRK